MNNTHRLAHTTLRCTENIQQAFSVSSLKHYLFFSIWHSVVLRCKERWFRTDATVSQLFKDDRDPLWVGTGSELWSYTVFHKIQIHVQSLLSLHKKKTCIWICFIFFSVYYFFFILFYSSNFADPCCICSI